jgi:hypothetical protein
MILAPRQFLAALLTLTLAVPAYSSAHNQLTTDTYDYDAFGNLPVF